MDLRIREIALPGIGRRYEMAVDGDQILVIVVQRDGGRQMGIRATDAQQTTAAINLDVDQAMAVAALLTGARFAVEREESTRELGEVAVETVALTERSPAVGLLAKDVSFASDADAAILAIIRDDTPHVIEDDGQKPCRAGDRVVVATRRDRAEEVVRELTG